MSDIFQVIVAMIIEKHELILVTLVSVAFFYISRHWLKREIFGDDWNPRIEIDGAVSKVEDLAHGWDGECIPYGGDGNTTLAALLVPNALGNGRTAHGHGEGNDD